MFQFGEHYIIASQIDWNLYHQQLQFCSQEYTVTLFLSISLILRSLSLYSEHIHEL